MRKRVCLDIRVSQKSSKYTGIGVYARRLTEKLLLIESETPFDFYFLVLEGSDLPIDIPQQKLIRVSRPKRPESLQETFDVINLRRKLKILNIALLHSLVPNFIKPANDFKVVVTIHDIIPDLISEENNGTRLSKILYKIKMRSSVSATHIITNSQTTTADYSRKYNVSKDKISTTYLASQFETTSKEIKNTSKRVQERAYIFYIGGYNFRKNVELIIHSFNKIRNEFPDVDLLLGGKPTVNQYDSLNSLIKTLDLDDRIIWLGFVDDNDLPGLYAWSECFVYPSLYEGFGIPVLEAMKYGAPVITSNKSSLPEIISSAGILIDPFSQEEMVNAMRQILANKEVRDRFKALAFERSTLFSWEKCALQTVEIYNKILV